MFIIMLLLAALSLVVQNIVPEPTTEDYLIHFKVYPHEKD